MRTQHSLNFIIVILLSLPAISFASMVAPCGSCHTMHNSSNGQEVVPAGAGVQPSLLNNTCYGCHTSSSPNNGTDPYVLQLPGPPTYGMTGTGSGTDTLSGGNFYWVAAGNDAAGHNVDGITPQTTRTPPGSSLSFDTLSCAGTNGCHGDRTILDPVVSIAKSHHGNQGATIDGNTVATSYRFLLGVVGIEDADWEFQADQDNHNQYNGYPRNAETETSGTISHLCAQCHGDFHVGPGNLGIFDGTNFGVDPWIRHPTDIDMNGLGGEYADYNGPGNPYSVISPVASDLNTVNGVKTNVLQTPDDAIVMCLSCHRAHGSPYDAILRWDYKNWPGGGFNGCGICHSAKN